MVVLGPRTGRSGAPWLQTRMTPYFQWIGEPRRARRNIALYCGVLLALGVVLVLVPDSWLISVVKSKTAMQALFGLLLSSLIIVRFGWWVKYSPPVSVADIRLFSRRLSRMVYLVLYLIIGAQEIVNISGGPRGQGGAAQDLWMLKPTSQAFVVYGLIALVLIRVLAYLTWRHRLPPRADSPGNRPIGLGRDQ